MKTWYTITAKKDEREATVDIFDEIGLWGITARDFIDSLKAAGEVKKINLRINSPGGAVFDGLAIYNALKYHDAAVEVTVYGIAASIASVIAMAGDKVMIPENAFMMIHDPTGIGMGNAKDLRELADTLEKIKSGLVRSYVSKTGQTEEMIVGLMAAESWLSAQEAKDLGFADEVLAPVKLAALADVRHFKNLPKTLPIAAETEDPDPKDPDKPAPDPKPDPEEKPDPDKPKPPPPPDPADDPAEDRLTAREAALQVNELCKQTGVPELAGEFLAQGLSPAQVGERLKGASDIRAACLAAKLPERANRYIKAGFTLAEARSDLFEILNARDVHIDNRLPIRERRVSDAAVIDYREIYEARRRK